MTRGELQSATVTERGTPGGNQYLEVKARWTALVMSLGAVSLCSGIVALPFAMGHADWLSWSLLAAVLILPGLVLIVVARRMHERLRSGRGN